MSMDAKGNARQLLAIHGRWLTADEFCIVTGRAKVDHARDWLRAHVDAGILKARHRRDGRGRAPVEYTLRPSSEWPGALREVA